MARVRRAGRAVRDALADDVEDRAAAVDRPEGDDAVRVRGALRPAVGDAEGEPLIRVDVDPRRADRCGGGGENTERDKRHEEQEPSAVQ